VGRERELGLLHRILSDGPAPVVVLIEGEAGIGKSRLVHEFLKTRGAHAPTRRALTACCPPFRQPHTLSPVVDAVKQVADDVRELRLGGLAGALRPLFPEWAEDLPPSPEPAEDATAARHRVFRALAELLERLDVEVLVLEDAHWADEATLEFLLFLAAAPRAVRLLITCRPEDVPAESLLPRLARFAAGGRRLELSALDVPATAQLVSSMLSGSRVSDEFATFLYEHTGGVPLAVEESVRLMVDRGDIFRRRGEMARRPLADIAVPPTLRDAVLERVRRLGREALAVLWAAAVLADPVDERMLRAVCGLPAGRLRHGLGEALDGSLLVEDDRGLVSFRHVLVSRAVYEAISRPQRRLLHLRAGHALERVTPLPVARLATHYSHAGETAKWCEYAELAADMALTPGDEATASALLHDLIVHADLPAPTVARLASKITFTSPSTVARCEELLPALRAVLEQPGLGRVDEAQLRAQLGRVYGVMEDFEAAYAELERAAPHLPRGSVAAARAMLLLAWPQGVLRPVSAHLRWLRRASEVSERLEPAQQLDFLAHRATGLLMLGEEEGWAAAARVPRDAATAPERLVLAIGHMNIGEAAMFWGRHAEARQWMADALHLAEIDEHARCRSIIMVKQAHLDWFTGSWDGLLERAVALAADEDLAPVTRYEAELIAGQMHAVTGSVDAAAEYLLRAHAAMRRHVLLDSLESAAALGRLHLAAGDVEAALRLTDGPLELVAGRGFWIRAADVLPVRVAALAAAGRADEAAALLPAFARWLRGRDAPVGRAAMATCRAMIAEEPDRAATAFAEAATAWRASAQPYQELQAREGQARSLLAADRTDTALPLLAEVGQMLAKLGASVDADRVAHELRRHGVPGRTTWRGGRRGYGDQLSPRELEVVQRVVAGHTTRQIAEQLSRSPDTVYSQLRSAMRKLGVPSRTALAVRAAELGITGSFTIRH
jgi:DNA-binding CsgD family transcriptional regulator/tetratricopeptide (TPR) repeat protein